MQKGMLSAKQELFQFHDWCGFNVELALGPSAFKD